jgi:hypothetical protein
MGDAATIARVATLPVTKAAIAAISSGGPVPGVPVKAPHRRDILDTTVVSEETSGPRGEDIAHTSLMIAVDAGGQAMDAEVRRQVVIVVGFAVGIDVGLQRGDCISELRGLDCMKKDASASAIAKMETHLSLEAKVKEISLREAEDVVRVRPLWDLYGDNGIKAGDSQLEYTPEKVVPVP